MIRLFTITMTLLTAISGIAIAQTDYVSIVGTQSQSQSQSQSQTKTQTKTADPLREAAAAVVMIDHRGQGGGSGSYLGAGWVITCQHLFRDDSAQRNSPFGRVSVTFPSGYGSEGVIVATDATWDLALLKLRRPPADSPFILPSETVPAIGEPLYFAGYGGKGELKLQPAQLTGFGGDKHLATRLQDTLILAGAARQGDSGGPILTSQGKLAGVLWGSSQTNVVGTQIGRVWEFVRRYQRVQVSDPGDASAMPSTRPFAFQSGYQLGYPSGAQTGCRNGQCPQLGSPYAGRPPANLSPPAITVDGNASRPALPVGCNCDWKSEAARLRESLTMMRDNLASLEQRLLAQAKAKSTPPLAGPIGPPGPEGRVGPAGPEGPQGPAAKIDLDQLAEQVKQRLAGSIRVRVQPK